MVCLSEVAGNRMSQKLSNRIEDWQRKSTLLGITIHLTDEQGILNDSFDCDFD
jgi:hypothetical protein